MQIGVIGLGKIGEAIIQGLLRSKVKSPQQLQATTRSEGAAKEGSERLKIRCHTDNAQLASSSDIIVLCTKPHQARLVLDSIQNQLNQKKLLISVCASLKTDQISGWINDRAPVIRAMPNTPCLIGQGMTALCSGAQANSTHLSIAEKIFETLGKTVVVEEALMDGVTGLSGCGPAYVYLMIEALSEAGVKVGLRREISTLLAAQTLAGAAQMVMVRGIHPAALKDEVTTPAGSTIDGLMALEEGKMRVTLIKAVLAATKRCQKSRKMLSS